MRSFRCKCFPHAIRCIHSGGMEYCAVKSLPTVLCSTCFMCSILCRTSMSNRLLIPTYILLLSLENPNLFLTKGQGRSFRQRVLRVLQCNSMPHEAFLHRVFQHGGTL